MFMLFCDYNSGFVYVFSNVLRVFVCRIAYCWIKFFILSFA